MKIFVKAVNPNGLPKFIDKGEWVDLYSSEEVRLGAPKVNEGKVSFSKRLIFLGVAMQLPEGYEAIIAPRSSTYNKFKVIQANHIGVIDSSYSGDNDIWMFNAVALDKSIIHKGDRICQFRIQLSQKATVWQKLKWLFTSKIEFIPVEKLQSPDRGGFGTTGSK